MKRQRLPYTRPAASRAPGRPALVRRHGNGELMEVELWVGGDEHEQEHAGEPHHVGFIGRLIADSQGLSIVQMPRIRIYETRNRTLVVYRHWREGANYRRYPDVAALQKIRTFWETLGQTAARKVRDATLNVPGGRIYCWEDEDYPVALRDVSNPPAVLYVRGDLGRLTRRALALVGTTDPSPPFARVATSLARSCAMLGIQACVIRCRGANGSEFQGDGFGLFPRRSVNDGRPAGAIAQDFACQLDPLRGHNFDDLDRNIFAAEAVNKPRRLH